MFSREEQEREKKQNKILNIKCKNKLVIFI